MIELCRSVGFIPTLYNGTVDSILASADLVAQQRCVLCAPSSCVPTPTGIVWRPRRPPVALSLVGAMAGGDSSDHVGSFGGSARTLSEQLGWLYPPLAG